MSGHEDAWAGTIGTFGEPRTEKPRRTGITAVIDKGLGLHATDDLIEAAGSVVDQVKLGFGTSAAVDAGFLRRKVARLVESGIVVYPGGTMLEAAWVGGRMAAFIERAHALGFSGLEVSDGTVELPDTARREAIERGLDLGLVVVTEVGKKDPARQLSSAEMVDRLHADLALGASLVTIEARESGRGTGIFDMSGNIVADLLDGLAGSIRDLERVLWEAPQQAQQAFLIRRFGPNVNLANIATSEVLALEALRRGLRFETLRAALQRDGAGRPTGAPS
ncbi:MAG: Phosphosulfolactate synthase [Chloroflexi bacterium]|jgi:phosphosulfolactate synthase|nr:Phosphosulfolactate synthase [Chloroflexota bacterium]